MAIRAKLTTIDDPSAKAGSTAAGGSSKPKVEFTDEQKAARKERVTKAKDALARSVGVKGEHVAPGRTALKTFLQQLNDPRQPDDQTFEAMLEAPFKAPEKRKPRGEGGFGGGQGGGRGR